MTDIADPRTPRPLSGQDLAAFRQAVGLTQTALARAAGLSRHTVRRWEQKAVVDVEQGSFERLIGVLMPPTQPRLRAAIAHTREDRVIYHLQQRVLRACWLAQEQAERATNGSVLCGAHTRKGRPCRNMSEPGRRRCKFHGGKSTGPRTPEGRERIAEAQRRRWSQGSSPDLHPTLGARPATSSDKVFGHRCLSSSDPPQQRSILVGIPDFER